MTQNADGLREFERSPARSANLLDILPFSSANVLAAKWSYLIRLQIGATAASYGLVIDCLLLLRAVVGEASLVVAIFNMVALWLTAGCAVSFCLSLLAPHRKYWILWSLPGMLAFVLWYGVLFLPDRPYFSPDTRHSIVVSSFNVKRIGLYDLPPGTIASLERLQADLVGMQEVNPDMRLTELREMYPYQYYLPGIALASRLPFRDERAITYSNHSRKTQTVALRVTIDLSGQPVSVYVAYPKRPDMSVRPLVYDDRDLKAAIDRLVEALDNDPNPVILLCDCNFSSTSENYRRLATLLTDSWQVAGFGLGLTVPVSDRGDVAFPVIRGDYVWHSAEFATLDVAVMPDHGESDHYPVRAELGLIGDP